MAKKYRNLIARIAEEDNLREAYRRTAKGRRFTHAALQFKEYAELNLQRLGEDLLSGAYRTEPVREFMVHDPKPRVITALSFRDRVAQHALCQVIGPIFEATLLPRTYACRTGFGTHAGVVQLQADMRRLGKAGQPVYALKTDFSKFFPNVDRQVLHTILRRKVSCRATLALMEAITPTEGRGIPIGSLTSQLYANVYGGEVDRFIHFGLGQRYWYRYMDDIVVLGYSSAELRSIKDKMGRYAAEVLGLRFSHWAVSNVQQGVNFLGYRIWPTHKLLRRSTVTRAKRRLAELRDAGDGAALERFAASWVGHASWADSHNLLHSLGLEIRQ
jgi:retron-type reverse transcriptase